MDFLPPNNEGAELVELDAFTMGAVPLIAEGILDQRPILNYFLSDQAVVKAAVAHLYLTIFATEDESRADILNHAIAIGLFGEDWDGGLKVPERALP